LSVNIITVLFINFAVLLKQCFAKINTCLCELIHCAGEESFGPYIQISTVKHTQQLIEVNYKSDKSKITVVHVRMCSCLFCEVFDLYNYMF
jgi:hypothetical protein